MGSRAQMAEKNESGDEELNTKNQTPNTKELQL
jgi:hypothetical protein